MWYQAKKLVGTFKVLLGTHFDVIPDVYGLRFGQMFVISKFVEVQLSPRTVKFSLGLVLRKWAVMRIFISPLERE